MIEVWAWVLCCRNPMSSPLFILIAWFCGTLWKSVPWGSINWEHEQGDIFLIWTCFGSVFCNKRWKVWFVLFWTCMMNYDGFSLFLCDTDHCVDFSALHRAQWQIIFVGLLRHFNGVLMEKESDPCDLLFTFFLLLKISILTHCYQKLPQQEEPNYRYIEPMLKRASLLKVFGITQRQCLSCLSANRMLCAGEQCKIRTDNGKREKKQKRQQRGRIQCEQRKKQLGVWYSHDLLLFARETKEAEVRLHYYKNSAYRK